jgi:hypothetical protein
MNYDLPKEAFIAGEASSCYLGRKRTKLSEIDRQTVLKMYSLD